MKVFCKLLSIVAIFITLLAPVKASEQRVWPIISFVCDQQNNVLKLKNEVKWGDAGKNFPFNEAQGTYNPWQLVAIEDRHGSQIVVEKASWDLRCNLSGFEYSIILKPKIFNSDFNGSCGDRLSVIISIYKGSEELLADKSMVEFCRGNAPVLRGIKIQGGSSRVQKYEVSPALFY
ncbi:MAG TPA: hypothetical protein VIQ81_08200 [Gammaproteobacteria bacterium]